MSVVKQKELWINNRNIHITQTSSLPSGALTTFEMCN